MVGRRTESFGRVKVGASQAVGVEMEAECEGMRDYNGHNMLLNRETQGNGAIILLQLSLIL